MRPHLRGGVLLAAVALLAQHSAAQTGVSEVWRIVNAGPAPSSGHWAVFGVRLFSRHRYDTFLNRVVCDDPIAVIGNGHVLTSGLAAESSSPEVIFHDVIDGTQHWRSQHHTLAGKAWIEVHFASNAQVECVQLYQAGSFGNSSASSFRAQELYLERRKQDTGTVGRPAEWLRVGTWGGPESGTLPGFSWLMLPAGYPAHATFNACPREEAAGNEQAFSDCCVWPQIAWDGQSFSHIPVAFAPGASQHGDCTPGATVTKGTVCEVQLTECNAVAQMQCQGGQIEVDAREDEVGSESELQRIQECLESAKVAMTAGASRLAGVEYPSIGSSSGSSGSSNGAGRVALIVSFVVAAFACPCGLYLLFRRKRQGGGGGLTRYRDEALADEAAYMGQTIGASVDDSQFQEVQLDESNKAKASPKIGGAQALRPSTSGAKAAANVRKTVKDAMARPSWRSGAMDVGPIREEVMEEY